MATYSVLGTVQSISRGVHKYIWTSTGVQGIGKPLDIHSNAIMDLQVKFGTEGTSTVVIQGTNDTYDDAVSTGAWLTLSTVTGQAMSYTAGAMRVGNESPRHIRPNFSTVTTGNPVTVTMITRVGV